MSGIPFSPGSTYSTRLGPTSQAAIGCVNFVTTTAAGVTTPLIAGLVTFDKPLQDVINITVELKNSSKNALLNVGLTFDNDYGTFTANSCVVTWKNVNIRTCLSELYRKYNRFNL